MKRFLSICVLLGLLLSLAGCHSGEKNTVHFYYCRDPEHYQYFQEDGVIHGESRDLASHRNDLHYAVGLYLAGPMKEGLQSPFPRTTQLVSIQNDNGSIHIVLSDLSRSLTDAEFTLACACLSMTCMDLLPCTEVTIVSADRTITIHPDNIVLFDTHEEDTP